MLYLKAFTLASLLGTTIAAPYATTVDNSIPNIILERSPAATSAAGSTSSTLSCPSSDGATFTSSGYSFIVECGLDRPGNINMVYTANFATCIDACAAYSGCVDVSYVSDGGGACYMKNSILAGASSSGIWGARQVSASGTTSTTVKTSTTKTTSSTTTSKTTTSSKTTTTSSKTTTTSSKTTTTAAATTTASATGKRGLAYNTGAYGALFTPYPEVSWGYNWGQSRSGLSTHFDYVPMLWAAGTDWTNSWISDATAAINAGAKYVLGFNEPDSSSQANISPSAAATAWVTWMQPLASSSVKLVSPAVTNGGGETGLQWMKEFLGNCTSCTVDVIALHWYSDYGPDFESHIQQAYADFGKPIWVTEFGLTSSTDTQIESFLESVMPWMDSQSYVQRYAYFGTFGGYLLNSSLTALSDYGSVYASYT